MKTTHEYPLQFGDTHTVHEASGDSPNPLDQLIEQVLALPAEQRQSFLWAACKGDSKRFDLVWAMVLDVANSRPGFGVGPADSTVIADPDGESTAAGVQPGNLGEGVPRRIGRHRLVGRIGKGGMGVVFLAYDTKLHRRVAVKALDTDVQWDSNRRERFEREAAILAALNHPNIAQIFDFEEHDGRHYLVMEYVSGITLSDELQHGALGAKKTRDVCHQIASAMKAVHDEGIIHRDLKPDNVRIRSDRVVKVLDLGLGKRIHAESSSSSASPEDRTDEPITSMPGAVLGTPGYMSPEQIEGADVDHRADVFGFGCIMYECLSGKRAFKGRSANARMAHTLLDEPVWSAIPKDTPSSLVELVRECLVKEPSKRLAAMEQVLARLEEPSGEPRPAWPSTQGNAADQLPVELSSFIGRDEEVARVSLLLRTHPLVTVTGAGGCGKTRLAIRAARNASVEFTHGVYFVDLGTITSPDLIPDKLARALGLDTKREIDPLEAVIDAVRDRTVLLMLDNCEHLLDACKAIVRRILQTCPHTKVLATSRQALGIEGELAYRIPSLTLPGPHAATFPLDTLGAVPAIQLFIDRARLRRPEFALTEENRSTVVSICERLAGIPLALELAAGCTRAMNITRIHERLQRDLRFLDAPDQSGAAARMNTLNGSIEWSYNLLNEDEQSLFRRLSMFVDGWSIDAAEHVCSLPNAPEITPRLEGLDSDDILHLLVLLHDKSLIIYEESEGGGRYRFLEPVREFASKHLRAEEAEYAATRKAHTSYFHQIAHTAEEAISGPEQGIWLTRLHLDHNNLRAALHACLDDAEDPIVGEQLALALHRFWYIRGHLTEGMEWLDTAINLRPDAEDETRGRAYNAIGILAWQHGDFDTAAHAYEESLAVWRAVGDRNREASVLSNIGLIRQDRGDLEGGRDACLEAVKVHKELGNERSLVYATINLARALQLLGEYDEAIAMFEECLTYVRGINERHRTAWILGNLGEIAYRQDRHRTALESFLACFNEHFELQDPAGTALVLLWFALSIHVLGQDEDATRLLAAATLRLQEDNAMCPDDVEEMRAHAIEDLRERLPQTLFDTWWGEGSRLADKDVLDMMRRLLKS